MQTKISPFAFTIQTQDQDPGELVGGFVRYVFKNGTRPEKRELVSCLGPGLYLKDRRVLSETAA